MPLKRDYTRWSIGSVVLLVCLLQFRTAIQSTRRQTEDRDFLPPVPRRTITPPTEGTALPTRRPILVLHAGPMKTGTTTIQCQLRQLHKRGMLESHGIRLLETQSCRPRGNAQHGIATYNNLLRGHSWLPGCWLKWKAKETGMPQCWNQSYFRVLQETNNATTSPTDVIISTENILTAIQQIRKPQLFVQDLLQSLREAGNYQLLVVATYRHWHDWIVSVHQERNKVVEGARPKLYQWPGYGGKRAGSALDAIQMDASGQFVDRVLDFFSVGSRQEDSNLTTDLIISTLNMHAPPSLEYNFFCQALSHLQAAFPICHEANATWGDVKKMKLRNKADGLLLSYDTMAIEAFQRGYLPNRTKREQTIEFLREQVLNDLDHVTIQNISGWARNCPDEQLLQTTWNTSQQFLNNTLALWRQLNGRLPRVNNTIRYFGWDKDQFQQHLQASFQKAAETKRFCSVDAAATFDQNETAWKDLFQRIATAK